MKLNNYSLHVLIISIVFMYIKNSCSIINGNINYDFDKDSYLNNYSNPYLNNNIGNNIYTSYNNTFYKNSLRFLDINNHTYNFQPIRIFIDNTTLLYQQNHGLITSSYLDNILNIVQIVARSTRYLIDVIPSNKNLSVESCNGNILIEKTISGIGIITDLILFPYISFNNNITNELNPVYGKYCKQDSANGRPIAGYIAFSNSMNFQKLNSYDYYSTAALHSIVHILGFDEELFKFFKNIQTNKYYTDNELTLDDKNNQNNNPQMLYIEARTLETAKAYFNCSSLKGIPYLSKKYNNAKVTHWESRLMLGDLMTDNIYSDVSLSEITLSFLESTGWYRTRYLTGGLFRYGKNKGCSFIYNKCTKSNFSEFTNEFCTIPNTDTCSASRMSRGKCYIDDELPKRLPYQFVLFDSFFKGGLKAADYCPVSMTMNYKHNDVFNYDSCTNGVMQNEIVFGETIGENSACFLTNMLKNDDPSLHVYNKINTAVCLEYKCDYKTKTYTIKVKDNIYTCKTEGMLITSKSTIGSLQCPAFSLICTKSVPCKSIIDCIEKASINIVTLDKIENKSSNEYIGQGTYVYDLKEKDFPRYEKQDEDFKIDIGYSIIINSYYYLGTKILYIITFFMMIIC